MRLRPEPRRVLLGTAHVEHGLLLTHAGEYVLRRNDGGTRRLDAPWRAGRFVGRRVRIEGIRIGFDLLSVTSIAAASTSLLDT